MKNMSLVVLFFHCILHLNRAKQVNAAVTLHSKDIFPLFSEDEIWATQYKNQTEDIVQLNVVIDEMKIPTLPKDMIISFDIIHSDVAEVIERERDRLNNRTKWTAAMLPDFFFTEYRHWPEYVVFIDYILLQYREIASRSYMTQQTIQGRSIPVITLSTDLNDANKPALYIQAEVHAREWLANAATMYILNALCEGYADGDPEITEILNAINIFIAPTVNIDGYIYSWESDRMWRKNRRANAGGSFGVDLNRNYDGPTGTWCSVGASTNPTSNTYCGTSAFSEPEIEGARDFILNETYNIGAVVDMHTSGPLILYPWAHTSAFVPAPYHEQYVALSNAISEAIYEQHGVWYTPTQTLGQSAGTLRDFPFAITSERDWDKPIFSFTWEGRGPGFDPPPSNIIPAGQEQLAGMLTLARFVMDRDSFDL